MAEPSGHGSRNDERRGTVLRPDAWRPTERHILLGVSHPSDDPARHRSFEIRASYDPVAKGWIARVGEQNLNEQRGDWLLIGPADVPAAFPTAAACLGNAVASIVSAVDQEADES